MSETLPETAIDQTVWKGVNWSTCAIYKKRSSRSILSSAAVIFFFSSDFKSNWHHDAMFTSGWQSFKIWSSINHLFSCIWGQLWSLFREISFICYPFICRIPGFILCPHQLETSFNANIQRNKIFYPCIRFEIMPHYLHATDGFCELCSDNPSVTFYFFLGKNCNKIQLIVSSYFFRFCRHENILAKNKLLPPMFPSWLHSERYFIFNAIVHLHHAFLSCDYLLFFLCCTSEEVFRHQKCFLLVLVL